ncbi:MAG: Fic family protein [Clostridiales Family XIII bacterium]|jgi:Fic family protein|nr:Fic family protein [Clostridiales Family XIII bacterium]
MRYFDYSFLENGMLPAGLVNIVSAIAELRERENERRENYANVFTRLESIAKVQSVKGSNEIEGIVTGEQRIHEIVNQNSAPLNKDEDEIAGYRDALALVHGNFDTLDIRERDILRLHEIMLSHSPVNGGRYKQDDNIIMEIDASGERRVRFSPVPADETAETMEQLILAYTDARSICNVNQLLLIPCFVLDFLCIHPFADGNGRMSRLLSLLLLYKNGFDAGKYISFEEQINKTKAGYYEALKRSSEHWHDSKNSYFPFIENFIAALLYCYKELDKRFAVVGAKKATKRERVESTVLNSLLPISKREICYILPDVSPTTAEAALADMVKNGRIEKVGSSRSTKYIKKL